jgi:hypothetical protein
MDRYNITLHLVDMRNNNSDSLIVKQYEKIDDALFSYRMLEEVGSGGEKLIFAELNMTINDINMETITISKATTKSFINCTDIEFSKKKELIERLNKW